MTECPGAQPKAKKRVPVAGQDIFVQFDEEDWYKARVLKVTVNIL